MRNLIQRFMKSASVERKRFLFHGSQPGGPVVCGCGKEPSRADRLAFYGVWWLVSIAMCVSLGMGARWFQRTLAASDGPARQERQAVLPGDTAELPRLARGAKAIPQGG